MLKMGIKIEFTPLSLSLSRLQNLSLSQKMTYHSLLSDIEDEEVDIHRGYLILILTHFLTRYVLLLTRLLLILTRLLLILTRQF